MKGLGLILSQVNLVGSIYEKFISFTVGNRYENGNSSWASESEQINMVIESKWALLKNFSIYLT